ncbi:MAG: hypothetical protein HQ475_14910 [SAR202 cluster bacterium]|nr:hypothetical protein [SAR202 cluster bacterium]
MATKLNSEFNYRYLVIGETPWEKIKTLKGFLEGRIRASALEKVAELKFQAKLEELEYLKKSGGLLHVILNLQAEIIELESHMPAQVEAFLLNKEEIKIIKRVLKDTYEIAEPTRIAGYTDEQMFEANAMNEYTTLLCREIQAELIANGRPSPAKLKNAMACPQTFEAVKLLGLMPKETTLIGDQNATLYLEQK